VPERISILAPQIRTRRTQRALVLEPVHPLPRASRCVGDWLVHWAEERPEATFLAERDASGSWRRLGYRQALSDVEAIASGLLERQGTPDRPVMILSDNSIDAALLSLAAMHAGIPVSPVSPAYSLLSRSFERLREVADQLHPGFVFTDDPQRFAGALAALKVDVASVLSSSALLALKRTRRTGELERAFASVGPDTIAKVLFTSGSTGRPKGVVNTQRMLTSNQESLAACWPFVQERPPVVVDWLPWSHTFGGNHNFFLVLRNGGSLFIDQGRPLPNLIDRTILNMADVSPTLWFNVPRGFDQAVSLLERDRAAARAVFENLDLIFYAAAALSPSTRERLERVAMEAGRPDVFFTSAWGSTETAPLATSAHFPTRTTGILGVPVPGVEIALVPVQDRFELRVKGPNVTPGYWRPGGAIDPVALDEHGFLPTGDAGRLADEARPEAGIVFVGRLSENFKLSSGTWVNVAEVRLAVVEACAPLVLDSVIAGHDKDAIGALLFLSPAAASLPIGELEIRIRAGLLRYNEKHLGTSERVARALVIEEALSLDEGETTDKGYTNQRRVLERRSRDVDRLFADSAEGLIVG
jgi:feruloyl-CoA synthase